MKPKKWYRKSYQAAMGSALVVLTLYFVINAYIGVTYAIEVNAGQSGITIDQTDLFNITNMYPGQPAIESKQPLKVMNNGNSDFQCNISAGLSDGDRRLFDILKLNILDDTGVAVYSGNLGNLDEVTLATISPGASETFDFTLELPADVDNSYQRLSAAFQFNIKATGDSSGGGGGSGGGESGGGGSGGGESGGGGAGGGGSGRNEENPDEEEPEIILPPEPTDLDTVEPSESTEPSVPIEPIIQDTGEDIEMPDTGIPSRLPYYSVGFAAISVGLFLGLKRMS